MNEPGGRDLTGLNPVIHQSVEHLYGLDPASVLWDKAELVVLCLVRDGVRYVEEFLNHYDSLGVKHFVFLDNGSTDGTLEFLAAESGRRSVSVYLTELPYRDHRHEFKRYMIDRFGRRGRWILLVDMDEFFDYPRSRTVSLNDFLKRLGERGYTAVVSQMLDMFPAGPLSEDTAGLRDGKLREVHRYYDLSDVKTEGYSDHPWVVDNEVSNERIMAFRGGIRRQVFGVNATLTKHPLIFLDDRIRPLEDSAHWTNGASVADVSCVLYHYKFLEGFHEFARRAARDESYADASSEYKGYLETLEREPELRLRYKTAAELHGTDELVASGFLVTSADYDNWADDLEWSRVTGLAENSPQELAREYLHLRAELNAGGRAAGLLSYRLHELGLEAIRQRERLQDRVERLQGRVERLEGEVSTFESSRLGKIARYLGGLKKRFGIGRGA